MTSAILAQFLTNCTLLYYYANWELVKNRFENTSQFFHFNDSSIDPRGGEDGHDAFTQ